ncbi:hypothetical protein BOX15_Mlig021008g1 [Macrostomum lignano]|uniref:Heat shock protein 75 kDa, mitochondrial n=1 Tax=Macrostomum lignano TaxID=282301 RepID=A0A267H840_9PLAT|nr:hypothetical protein BOX15_Mlig021008g1 [Macrostomum lignano]
MSATLLRLSANAATLARHLPVYGRCLTNSAVLTASPSIRPTWQLGKTRFSSIAALYNNRRPLSTTSSSASSAPEPDPDYHSIISNAERSRGSSERHTFQAETRQLLDIVAKSLYSDRHVFVRELVSNASDALEKLRHLRLSSAADSNQQFGPLEIHLQTDEDKRTLTIQDTGIGMTRDEAVSNLGTIARSGSQEFIKQAASGSGGQTASASVIGQFGVGFYASFMVADKIDVYSQSSCQADAKPVKWSSDGLGSYEVSEAENVSPGTKIVLHLKPDALEFAKDENLRTIVQRYSGFVAAPIFVNGRRVNPAEPLWLKDASKVTQEEHQEFYRLVSGAYDAPRYVFSYKTDAPLNLRALLYIPESKPALWEMSRDSESGVALYSKRVLVLPKAQPLLPRWLRFLKGVVDSEDVPLNLSRELLQDSRLIRRINLALTGRVIRFLSEQAKKDAEKYAGFHRDFGLFLKEGIVTTQDQAEREKIADLLRFETSAQQPGQLTSLSEYVARQDASSRNILFLSAPSRQLAETSPYLEAVRHRNLEVIFLYEPYDELVLMQLGQFAGKQLQSVENEASRSASDDDNASKDEASTKPDADSEQQDSAGDNRLSERDANDLSSFMTTALAGRVKLVKPTNRLTNHPCVVCIKDLGAVRHLLRTTMHDRPAEERLRLMEPVLEINAKHPLIRKLSIMRTADPDLAKLFALQLCDNALTIAGVLEDPRAMIDRLNELLTKAAEKMP